MKIRQATLADVPAIGGLIATSARVLGASDYTAGQIDAALLGAWGVDTELIRDGTYFVGSEDQLVLCGGWGRRATSFGGDAHQERESRLLEAGERRSYPLPGGRSIEFVPMRKPL